MVQLTISNIFKPVVATADGPVDEITQTVMTKSTIRQLEAENERLKRRPTNTDAIYDWETYQEKPDMVQFYTGLINYGVLCVLYKYIEAHLNQFRYCMPKKRQLLVVLIKLRMNYLFQDMAYRLNVSVSTIQRVFHETLTVMYYRLSFLLKWPERDQLRKSDPYCFRQAFGDKVTVVIDCFELMAETPKGAKNQTFYVFKLQAPSDYQIFDRNFTSGGNHIFIQGMGWSSTRSTYYAQRTLARKFASG